MISSAGCSSRARKVARLYQAAHSLMRTGPAQSLTVQPYFMIGCTSYPARRAKLRIVGIHMSACESPTTTRVFLPAESPRLHSALCSSPRVAMHCPGTLYSELGSASADGVNGEGIGLPFCTAVTAVTRARGLDGLQPTCAASPDATDSVWGASVRDSCGANV